MPRAVIADEFGPPESYRLAPHDPGHPGPGQVRVAIKAAGISYVDALTAMGKYQVKPPLPFIPGSEFAGIVEELGEGVTHLAVGDRVFGTSWGGVFAEAGVFKADILTKVPDAMALEEAAVLPVNYLTAYYALADRGRAKPGETLLVLGAAGGTGSSAFRAKASEAGKRLRPKPSVSGAISLAEAMISTGATPGLAAGAGRSGPIRRASYSSRPQASIESVAGK